MMAITTSNSIRVNPNRGSDSRFIGKSVFWALCTLLKQSTSQSDAITYVRPLAQSGALALGPAFGNLNGLNDLGARIRPWHRWALAAGAGALLALSFPKNGVAGLAWVAPGFMLLPALGRP